MKCDKLFKEAFEGIEFRYKLDDTLENLGNQKLTAKQLEGYLLGKGVSPKEIKQSGVLDGMENDNRALSGSEWLDKSGSQKIYSSYNNQYANITLSGVGNSINSDYKATLSKVKKPKDNAPSTPHFSDEISGKESLLGWRRTHVDEINGKKTLVLNELQSDWAQTERAGRGMFESNYIEEYSPAVQDLIKAEGLTKEELADSAYMRDKISNWLEEEFITEAEAKVSNKNIVADFPMSEIKHHQFQIVGAINDAIKEGIDTVAIPIQRENELAGSAGVTKFYESLNTKILPDIRKKLEKQGLKIKVDRKPYKLVSLSKQEQDKIILDAYNRLNTEVRDYLDWSEIESKDNLWDKLTLIDNVNNSFDNSVDLGQDFYRLASSSTGNDLWTLTIEEVPNGKVKWDVYSVLAALGLGGVATQSEANTKMTNNPDIYKLSKKVGSKLNYNESNKEIIDYITSIESGGDYKAMNKESSAFGKYQILRGTMVEKAKELGLSLHEAKRPEGQEQVMNSLLSDYKERLKQFDLPITKENMFVLHNLGQTRGIRILRGTYSDSDINAMRVNLPTQERKLHRSAIPKAYAERYNIDVPSKQED